MADYFSPTVIRPTIPAADITALERLLLSHIFNAEPDGEGLCSPGGTSGGAMPVIVWSGPTWIRVRISSMTTARLMLGRMLRYQRIVRIGISVKVTAHPLRRPTIPHGCGRRERGG